MPTEQDKSAAYAIATGRRIYVYDQDQFDCLHTAKRPISDLAVYNNALVYAGSELGIRNAINGWVVAGARTRWSKIGVNDGILFGAMATDDVSQYGIWDVKNGQKLCERSGKTTLISGDPVLMDGGKSQDEGLNILMETRANGAIAVCRDPLVIGAVSKAEDKLCVARSAEIERYLISLISVGDRLQLFNRIYHSRIHQINSPLLTVYGDTVNFPLQFEDATSDKRREQIWEHFRMNLSELAEFAPGLVKPVDLNFNDECFPHKQNHQYRYRDLAYKDALNYYRQRWCPENIPHFRGSGENILQDVMANLNFRLWELYNNTNQIQGLVQLRPGNFLIGLNSGRLLTVTEEWWRDDLDVGLQSICYERELKRFPSGITAIAEIPEEVLGGIRARLKDKREAKFASIASQQKPIVFRKAA